MRMSEDQIEREVERMTNALDERYLKGPMTEAEYAAGCKRINTWAETAYRLSEQRT